MKNKMKIIIVFIILVTSQTSIYPQKEIDSILTKEELMNAEYEGSIKLKDGDYNLAFNAYAALILTYMMHTYCDLNGDSLVDAIVVLRESQGSGKYPNVIPVINDNGKPKPLKSLMLWTREEVKEIYKKGEFIFIDLTFGNKIETLKLTFTNDEFIIVE